MIERIAALLLRLHGRAYLATYGEDVMATIRARGHAARARGAASYAWFAARELGALAWSAVAQQRPDLDTAVQGRALSIDALRREVRLAGRRLLRTPGFSAAVVVMLGLAFAAATTVFTLVSAIVLAPLPFASSERLIDLDHAAPALGLQSGMGASIGVARAYEALPSIESVALYTIQDATLADGGLARRATFLQATPSLGSALGIQPQIGRWFTREEGEPGAAAVAVVTDAVWRRDFAAGAVIGRRLRIEGTSYEIIGVLAPSMVFPDPRIEFVIPLPLPANWTRATGFNYSGVARIAAGSTIDQVRREQRTAIASLASMYPADTEIGGLVAGGLVPVTRPLKDVMVGEVATTLWALSGAAGIVLLMACANLANLFLVRYEARHREVQLQRALGAGPLDVAAHVFSETWLAAAAAGALGHAIAVAAVDAIVRWGPQDVPRLHEVQVGVTGAAFTMVVAIAAGVLIGVLPLLRLSVRDRSPLADSARGSTPAPVRMLTRHVLMGAQLALAVVVTVTAGLLTQSFANVLRVDPGFRPESRLVFDASLARAEYPTRADAALFHSRVIDRLQTLPGVVSVAATSNLPLEGLGIGDPLDVPGRLPAASAPVVRFRRVSAGYFETLGVPLRAGRWFDVTDGEGGTASAIVNEAAAQLYFPGENPIGKQVRPRDAGSPDRWLTIVGVAANTATVTLSETTAVAMLYVPLRGSMWADVPSPHRVSYVVRTAASPAGLVAPVRAALAELNPGVAMARPERLEDVMNRARAPRALTMLLLLIAAVMSMIVGTVGVYAVMAYAVAQRGVEIGVRLAVGATPSQVTALIVRGGAAVIGIGVAAGVVLTMALASLVQSLLFGVAPLDWPTRLTVAAIVSTTALAASWWPAVRATGRNPLRALRGA